MLEILKLWVINIILSIRNVNAIEQLSDKLPDTKSDKNWLSSKKLCET